MGFSPSLHERKFIFSVIHNVKHLTSEKDWVRKLYETVEREADSYDEGVEDIFIDQDNLNSLQLNTDTNSLGISIHGGRGTPWAKIKYKVP